MDVGICLPATVPGVDGPALVEWARRAEASGFSSLGVIDRLVYANYDPLIALTAAAAVTRRIRLTTSILLAPLRNPAILAKQAATIDNFSSGRLVLGLAPGGRQDDYQAAGLDFSRRGRVFDRQLEEMTRIWRGEENGTAGPVGPPPARAGGPRLVIGGTSEAAFRRASRFGEGWIAGGGGPQMFAGGAEAAQKAWPDAGRAGEPRLVGLGYFSLGPRAEEDAARYLDDYYAFIAGAVEFIVGGAARSEESVREQVRAFADAGCDELVLFPCSTDAAQVDLLAASAL